MKISEVCTPIFTYIATVRIVSLDRSTRTMRTAIAAESREQARTILAYIFGDSNVLGVAQHIDEDGTKVLSADELRVKSMSDQAKRLQQQAKQIKARRKLQKAQQQLAKATTQSVVG